MMNFENMAGLPGYQFESSAYFNPLNDATTLTYDSYGLNSLNNFQYADDQYVDPSNTLMPDSQPLLDQQTNLFNEPTSLDLEPLNQLSELSRSGMNEPQDALLDSYAPRTGNEQEGLSIEGTVSTSKTTAGKKKNGKAVPPADGQAPVKRKRGPNKKKKIITPEQAIEKKNIHLRKNREAALKCRERKKRQETHDKQKLINLEKQHDQLKQQVQVEMKQLGQLLAVCHESRHRNGRKLMDRVAYLQTMMMTISQNHDEFNRQIEGLSAPEPGEKAMTATDNSSPKSGGESMSRDDSRASSTFSRSEEQSIGDGAFQSRRDSRWSTASDMYPAHDSGISDMGTELSPKEPLFNPLSMPVVSYDRVELDPVPASTQPQPRVMATQQLPRYSLPYAPVPYPDPNQPMPAAFPGQYLFSAAPNKPMLQQSTFLDPMLPTQVGDLVGDDMVDTSMLLMNPGLDHGN